MGPSAHSMNLGERKNPSSTSASEILIRYVEDFDEPRTKLAEYFSILLEGPRLSVEETHRKASDCYAHCKHCPDNPTGREAQFIRFTTSKFLTQIRHMGLRAKPFILR